MKYKLSICALLVVSLPAAFSQVASHQPNSFSVPTAHLAQPSGKPVARVNGVVLTDRDLAREEYSIFPYAAQHGGNIPADMEAGIRKGAMQMIVFEELVYQEAQRRKMTVAPEKLTKAEAEFRKQFKTTAEYQQYLKSEFGGSEAALRQSIKRSLLIDALLKMEVDRKSAVTLADLKTYYDKNAVRFEYPESFAIQTISVIPPPNATAAQLKDARKRADEALKQAKATKTAEEFGLLAEKISEDDYHVNLGDHKWVPRSEMPPEMLTPALKMQPGQMSDLIQVGPNYVIFRMNRHIPAGKVKFEEVKDKVRPEVEKSKSNQVRAAFDKKLRENAKVETL
jgi:parvulin-like peptidyl-prolyl isomerase